MIPIKIRKNELKTVECAYLYGDNHLVLLHTKNDPDAGRVSWATIYENMGVECTFEGRLIIIFPKETLPFIQTAERIGVIEPSYGEGSKRTHELGIRVGHVQLYPAGSQYPFTIPLLPDVLSGDFVYQKDKEETFPQCIQFNMWGTEHVKKIHKEK